MSQRNAVLLFMALAIVSAAFAPVSPDWFAGYLKAAGIAATGLAGLFMHPPSIGGNSTPSA